MAATTMGAPPTAATTRTAPPTVAPPTAGTTRAAPPTVATTTAATTRAASPAGLRAATRVACGALALVGLLLAGCGGGGHKGEASATTVAPADTTIPAVASDKPCDIVTQGEVEAAVGEAVRAGGSAGTGAGVGCTFTPVKGTGSLILVVKATDGSPAKYDQIKRAAAAPKDITGVGDKAFVAGGQAVVLKGSDLYVVVIKLDRPAAALADASTKLVKAAAG
jgi:hypothetical protein